MQLHCGIKSSLSGGTERISNSQRTRPRRSVTLRTQCRVTENPRGDVESLPIQWIRFGDTGRRNDWIQIGDSRSLESKISAALLFEARRGGGVSRASLSRNAAHRPGRPPWPRPPHHLYPSYWISPPPPRRRQLR